MGQVIRPLTFHILSPNRAHLIKLGDSTIARRHPIQKISNLVPTGLRQPNSINENRVYMQSSEAIDGRKSNTYEIEVAFAFAIT